MFRFTNSYSRGMNDEKNNVDAKQWLDKCYGLTNSKLKYLFEAVPWRVVNRINNYYKPHRLK